MQMKVKKAAEIESRLQPWTKQRVIEKIKKRKTSNKPLGYSAVRRDNRLLVSAACYHFGNWSRALEAAGLNPAEFKYQLKWNKKKIVGKILQWGKAGKSLKNSVVEKEYPALWGAAIYHFGCWKSAVNAAGLDYEEIKKLENIT
jgi:hypothetical protein